MQRILKSASFVYTPKGRGGAVGWFRGFDLLNRRWGFDRSTVYVGEEKYLDRWILYVNGCTLRLHKFYRGDDDRASHTHPWWFITIPTSQYVEAVFDKGTFLHFREVAAWRWHYRPAQFEHYVIGHGWVDNMKIECLGGTVSQCANTTGKTFYTIVISGQKQSTWGFYPEPGKFVNWKDWT